MLHYHIFSEFPHRHFLNIEIQTPEIQDNEFDLYLPNWRPGRYELGNFAQNIRDVHIVDQDGEEVKFEKQSKSQWRCFETKGKQLKISYLYYSNVLDAGSCFVDEALFYVNPIHCCMYHLPWRNEPLILSLDYPDSFELSLHESLRISEKTVQFSSVDHLLDSPFFASQSFQVLDYEVAQSETKFRLCFFGLTNTFDEQKVLSDFKRFTAHQLSKLGAFPSDFYDFIFLLTPFKTYHGVEHQSSTVIALGPESDVFTTDLYQEFLHVSSHELYHTWNVKALRTKDMKPYDYQSENYSRLGYWYEGLTTFMGDVMLWESGVISDVQWETILNKWLKIHFSNQGHEHLSVADSSFDTWLDGYKLGIPNRKVSIYQDGALCMLMLHAACKINGHEDGLHEVMRYLIHNEMIMKEGFEEQELKNLLIQFGGEEARHILEAYVYGTQPYDIGLKKACNSLNYSFEEKENTNFFSGYLGVQIKENKSGLELLKVWEGGRADYYGLAVGDTIVGIQNKPAKPDFSFNEIQNIHLNIKTKWRNFDLVIPKSEQQFSSYPIFEIKLN
ncbi:MAG: hypothetical protein ACPGEC_02035 [Flavobacteriales bacterium]